MKKNIRKLFLLLAVIITALVCFAVSASAKHIADQNEWEVGDTFFYGSYPQTKVTDEDVIDELDDIKKNWKSYGYYSSDMKYDDITLDKKKYRAVMFADYRQNGQQQKNGYYVNNVYYFEYEPVLWQVLDPQKGLVTTKYVIDGQPFFDAKYSVIEDYAGMKSYYSNAYYGYYCNNYAESTIRDWLNDDFYSTAFTKNDKIRIIKSKITNKGWNNNSKYACEDTEDKIFLLSQDDIMNSAYGFNGTSTRKTISTDYAKVQGSVSFSNGATILLRTAGISSNWVGAMYNGGGASNQDLFYSTFGIRPAMYVNLKSYRETYGWPLVNGRGSFGYPQDYNAPILERYNQVYGLNISTLIEGGAIDLFSKLGLGGNCFGLALLSLANYYNIIDLKDYFSGSDEYLYDYGYNSIVTYNQGRYPGQYFSVQGNNEVIELIEKALVMQNAVELRPYRVYASDTDFSSLIEHFSANNPIPLLVRMSAKNSSAHSVVLTGEGGVKLVNGMDGWFEIKVYDSNAPANSSKLSNPSNVYKFSDPYLLINPSNGKWKYFDGESYMYESEYDSFWGKDYIKFYDISNLDSSFFTKTLNLWYKKIQITFGASDITIKNKTGKTLFSIVDDEIKAIDENCDYDVFCAGDDGNLITFYTDETDLMIYTSEDSQLWGMSKNFYMAADLTSENELEIDFEKYSISSKAEHYTKVKNTIVAQNVVNDYAVSVEFESGSEEVCTLTVSDNADISTNVDMTEMNIESENNSEKPHIHIYNTELRKCIECGYTYKNEIEKNCNHTNTTEHQAKAATCLEPGYTESVFCADCYRLISGYEVISSIGHKDSNKDNICDECKKQFKIIESGECGQDVTYTLYDDGMMIVKGKGGMQNYDVLISEPLFSSSTKDKIETLIVEKGVTTVGDYTFNSCENLTSVTISDSVFMIGEGAFEGCDKLVEIRLPDGVTGIAMNAFMGCDNLKKIIIPDSLSWIGDLAFLGCDSLEIKYYLGTYDEWNALYGNDKLGEENNDLFAAKYGCKHDNKIEKLKITASCVESGYTSGIYCPDCEMWLEGHKEIPPAKHSFTEIIIDSVHLVSAATTESPAVYRYDCANCGAISDDLTFTYGEKLENSLGKPSKITATQSTSVITLNWSAVDGANIYRIYYKDGSSWIKIGDVTVLRGVIKNRKVGQKYTFAVKAGNNKDGKVTWSDTYTTITTATKTAKPAKVAAAQNTSAIKLAWSAVNGADGYRIFYKSGNTWKVCVSSTAATSHTFKNLKAGAKYIFAVQPYIKTSSGVVWGEYAEFMTATKPAVPASKVTSPSKGRISLTFGPVNGADGYQVWYKIGNGAYKLYKTYGKTGTINFSNLKSGTKYTFAVRAGIKTSGGNIFGAYKEAAITVK